MCEIFGRYWQAYGGFRALFASAYLYLAFAFTLFLWPHWFAAEGQWWQFPLQIMPNMLGFSLGGYAIWLAMGDDNFRSLVSGASEDGTASPYMQLSAAFVHFILMQMLSLLSALAASAYSGVSIACLTQLEYYSTISTWLRFLGCWLFIYALATGVAATMQLLRVSSWYDTYITNNKPK